MLQLSHPQQNIYKNYLQKPSEQEMISYLKKNYLEEYDFNDHVDNVRKNLLKRKTKQLAKDSNLSGRRVNKNEESCLLETSMESQTFRIKNNYLNQLEKKAFSSENKGQEQLPQQIKNNKLLCSLYKKLDGIQFGIIKQQEKLQTAHKTKLKQKNKKSKQYEEFLSSLQLNQQQRNFNRSLQTYIQQSRKKVQQKSLDLQRIKSTLLNQQMKKISLNNCANIFNYNYIQNLAKQTQKGIVYMGQRLNELQQRNLKMIQLKIQKIGNQNYVKKLAKQVRELICQIQNRKAIFL